MTNLAAPLWLLLLLPLAYSGYRMLRRARSQALPYPRVKMIPSSTTWRQKLSNLPPVLMILGIAMIIVAAARPQTVLSKSNKSKNSIAIEMAVDISGSMEERDLSPPGARGAAIKTRLDVVKETFAEFVNRRPDDLIGLVAFGGYATTRCPLTFDHEALLHVLKGTEISRSRDSMETMTAIGDGLAMAAARLAAATNIETRIVILLSDGVNNAGIISPEQAIAVAKQQGIVVYTIGIGNPEMSAAVPAMGLEALFQRMAPQGYALDEALLKHIAASTGGMYFNVRNKDGLENALAEIETLQKTDVEDTVYMRQKEHFAPFLASGAVLVLLALLLAPHSRRSLI